MTLHATKPTFRQIDYILGYMNPSIERRLQFIEYLENINDTKCTRKAKALINKINMSIYFELCQNNEINNANQFRSNNLYLIKNYPEASEWIKTNTLKHISHESKINSEKIEKLNDSAKRRNEIDFFINNFISAKYLRKLTIISKNDLTCKTTRTKIPICKNDFKIKSDSTSIVVLTNAEINKILDFILNKFSEIGANKLLKEMGIFLNSCRPAYAILSNKILHWSKNDMEFILVLRIANEILKDECLSSEIASIAVSKYWKNFCSHEELRKYCSKHGYLPKAQIAENIRFKTKK